MDIIGNDMNGAAEYVGKSVVTPIRSGEPIFVGQCCPEERCAGGRCGAREIGTVPSRALPRSIYSGDRGEDRENGTLLRQTPCPDGPSRAHDGHV